MRPTAEVASTQARRERVWDPTTWEILCLMRVSLFLMHHWAITSYTIKSVCGRFPRPPIYGKFLITRAISLSNGLNYAGQRASHPILLCSLLVFIGRQSVHL